MNWSDRESVNLDPEKIREIVPTTLQNMFERQFDQLSESEREIVETAAAEGESFSTASIAAALVRDGAEVENTCEALVRRQVVLKRAEPIRFPDGAGSSRYSFLHVLCRDALYRRLLPSRQSRLHGLLGNAAEVLYASDPSRIAAELAGHFELAGDYPKAIHYLRMAADGAAGRFSNREAARHLEQAIQLIERAGDTGLDSIRMDLLEQRALLRMSTMDPEGAAADLAAVELQARLTGDANRQVKALIASVMPWGFLDYRRCLAVIEEARKLKPGVDPELAALVDSYRGGVGVYFFGWKKDLAELLTAALPVLQPVRDPQTRCQFLWMEAFLRIGASEYGAACRAARESREYARKAGSFHQYFVATHTLVAGLGHGGNLGDAYRTARETAELAATNHHLLEQFWMESLQAFIAIEAFDFARALPICERVAHEPMMMRYHLTPHVLLWLGLARLGNGMFEEASEALDRLDSMVEDGGVGFEYRFPLLQGQASCAQAKGDFPLAKSLFTRSIALAEEHRTAGYAAQGHRMLAEIASQEGQQATAVEHITAAMAALAGTEILNIEWQVYATASRILSASGRREESEEARTHAVRIAERVAETLAGEPPLRQSLLRRVEAQLSSAASA